MNYAYRAQSRTGEPFAGEVEAANIHLAADKLRSRGLWVTHLAEVKIKKTPQERLKELMTKDVKLPFGIGAPLGGHEAKLFLEELSVLLEAGLPLQQALSAMTAAEVKTPYQKMTQRLEREVRGGRPLSGALALFPEVFSGLYRPCVEAGEESGSLDKILSRLAAFAARSEAAREKLKSALLYPLLLLTLVMAALLGVALFMLPAFAALLAGLHGELPLPTRLLLAAADFLKRPGALELTLLLALSLPALVAFIYLREDVRPHIDHALLHLPLIGGLWRRLEYLHLISTLAVLIESGVRPADALALAEKVPQNRYLRRSMKRVKDAVRGGSMLRDALALAPLMPQGARELIAAGEQAGKLEEMLRFAERDLELATQSESERLLTLAEPALMLVTAALLLFLVLAIILPVLNMMETLS